MRGWEVPACLCTHPNNRSGLSMSGCPVHDHFSKHRKQYEYLRECLQEEYFSAYHHKISSGAWPGFYLVFVTPEWVGEATIKEKR